jgi:hypothetical protein
LLPGDFVARAIQAVAELQQGAPSISRQGVSAMFATLLDLFHEGSWLATEHWSQRQEIAVENANHRDYRYFSVFGGWHDARSLVGR